MNARAVAPSVSATRDQQPVRPQGIMPPPASRDPQVESSLRESLRDAAAFSVMAGGGESYFAAFAIFLKASTQQIAWLAALPSLVGSLAQLLSVWLGQRAGRQRLIVTGATVQAATWLPLMLVPVLLPGDPLPWLILCVALYHAAGNLIAPQWASLMGDLVPGRRRGRYFARRTRLANLTTFLAMVAAGGVLDVFSRQSMALEGYVLVFSVAAAARLISARYLRRMHDPSRHMAMSPAGGELRRWLGRLRGSPFLHFSVSVALMQGAVAIAAPFFSVHMLRNLQLSYLQYMGLMAASVLAQFLTLNTWGRISDAFGNRLVLATTGLLIPVIPALWLVSDHYGYLLAVQAMSGLAWGGFSLSTGNFLYDLLPGRRLAPYMALHSVASNLVVFCGALLGGYLAAHLPVVLQVAGLEWRWRYPLFGVFALSAITRLAVSVALLSRVREVRDVRPMSVGGLIFRAARFNAVSGVVFDIVGAVRRRDPPQRQEAV